MSLTPQFQEHAPLIGKYGNGGFVVRGENWRSAITIYHAVQALDAVSVDQLTEAALAPLLEAEALPELVLFGTGTQTQPVPQALRARLDAQQIGFDAMDTGAACRTFNVLQSEDRRVAAILLPV